MLLPGRLLLGAALLKTFFAGFFFFGRSGLTSPSENTSSGKSELTDKISQGEGVLVR